ncbi:MAG: imidazole glycerol phosphate synthase subunit HisH [Desulfovibrionaceae bacterium]|jgi:glutamine amidotransferase|nr:imidazole glycerol phosphate synthase subunit HisH [Desulfovibrionaceae bacterium]
MIGIVNYGLGNLRSVAGAVQRVGYDPRISSDPGELARADKLILPGVGAFGDGMRLLRESGLADALSELVLEKGRPVLGICLGFQLLAKTSCEFGEHEGLGWIDADVLRLEPGGGLRLPHVGWNDLERLAPCPLFDGVPEKALFYYVHSYHVRCNVPDIAVGACEYGRRFTSVIRRDNIYGTQFHPEKSQQAGLRMLLNFLERG